MAEIIWPVSAAIALVCILAVVAYLGRLWGKADERTGRLEDDLEHGEAIRDALDHSVADPANLVERLRNGGRL